MSDGPYKCLPMNRKWKKVAFCAEKSAFSASEVADAMLNAVAQDFSSVPLSLVEGLKECFIGGPQLSLLPNTPDKVESIRHLSRGSVISNLLVDHASQVAYEGLTGETALLAAIERTASEHIDGSERQMVEHYCRKSNNNHASTISNRIKAAKDNVSISTLASQIASNGRPSMIRGTRNAGLDDGVEL